MVRVTAQVNEAAFTTHCDTERVQNCGEVIGTRLMSTHRTSFTNPPLRVTNHDRLAWLESMDICQFRLVTYVYHMLLRVALTPWGAILPNSASHYLL